MHYRISELIPKLKKLPFVGKALAAFLSAAHVMVVYNDVLRKGKIECQNQQQKLAKIATKKSALVKPSAQHVG